MCDARKLRQQHEFSKSLHKITESPQGFNGERESSPMISKNFKSLYQRRYENTALKPFNKIQSNQSVKKQSLYLRKNKNILKSVERKILPEVKRPDFPLSESKLLCDPIHINHYFEQQESPNEIVRE